MARDGGAGECAWTIRRGEAGYPASLVTCLGEGPPEALVGIGPAALLSGREWLALCSSVRCPGDAILGAYDAAVALRDAGVPVAGGFDAPMEKECLRFLLRGTQPMLILRSPGQRPPRVAPAWRPAFAAGRLLLAAPFAEAPRRLTRRSAFQRNRVLVALSSALFVVHAQPESYTESLVHEALKWGKPVYTLDLAENAHLLALGARPLGALGGPLSEAQ